MMEEDIVPHAWQTDVDCIVYVDNMLLTNSYKIEVGFDTSTANPVLHDIAFEKISMFFEILMSNSIIISKNDFQEKEFEFQNNFIQTPEFLNDQALGSLVYSKLVSLVGDDLLVSYVKISSRLGKNIRYTINSASPELHILLPTKEEWWDTANITHSPWWLRSDPATYDIVLEGEEIFKGDFSWEEHFEEDLKEAKSLDSRTKFQIITGGKDEAKQPK